MTATTTATSSSSTAITPLKPALRRTHPPCTTLVFATAATLILIPCAAAATLIPATAKLIPPPLHARCAIHAAAIPVHAAALCVVPAAVTIGCAGHSHRRCPTTRFDTCPRSCKSRPALRLRPLYAMLPLYRNCTVLPHGFAARLRPGRILK
ncbi:hypothetical protein MVEN_01130400 [Mycena venus]|uniref:Uncharacterized protein n=1 Tax=Mycena venus TaxID=2733690 RepID=A0A8H7CXQ5_9AGAR|nr:hypothetical protein MVEN_01130400 [Mycena venus]